MIKSLRLKSNRSWWIDDRPFGQVARQHYAHNTRINITTTFKIYLIMPTEFFMETHEDLIRKGNSIFT